MSTTHSRPLRAGLLALAAGTALATAEPILPKPAILFVGKPHVYPEIAYLDELEQHGFDVEAAAWPDVTPRTLRRYHAIVITHFEDDGSTVEAGGVKGESGFGIAKQRVVEDYLKAGGGVLVFLNTGNCYSQNKLGTVPAWFKRFGLDFYAEALSDPEREVLASAPSVRRYSQKYAWTETMAKHPITEGVKRLWYPVGWGGHVVANAAAVTCGHQWDKLVQTGPSAKILGPGEAVWAELYRKEFPAGPHTLLAVRKANNGRLAVLGLNPMWAVWSPYHPALGSAVMKAGEQGEPSDLWRLLENTYRWLAEPSLQMGIYGREAVKRPPVPGDTPAIAWSELTFPPPPATFYRGTVGAHTALSTGKGTVADWAAAARQAGFDFLVFAEDLAAMDGDKWKQLQADCTAATTDDFIAWPGLEYRNAAGTRGFMPLGYREWFPKEWLTDDGKAVNIDRGWMPEKGWAAKTGHQSGQIMAFLTWWHNGFFDFANGPTPSWDHKLYCFFPVWSAERRQPLDNALDQYLHATSLHVNPAAYALDLVYDPADLASAIPDGRPHLAVCADADPRYPDAPTLRNTFSRMVVNTVPDGMGSGNYRGWSGPVATQGPTLRWMFRGGYQWEGVELPRYWIERHAGPQEKDWYMPSWYRLKLRLDAASPAGLKEVAIYDGETLFRRFDPQGAPQYEVEMEIAQCPTRHLVAVVTDQQGRQAVSREIWLEQQTMLYNYCGDRVNAPYTAFSPIHGHPYRLDGPPPVYEVRRFFVDLVSPDLAIERFRSDAVYRFSELSDEFGWHNWAPHHPREDYVIEQRAWLWYQGHGRQVSWATHPSQGIHWDGFVPVEEVAAGQLPAPRLNIMDSSQRLLHPADLDADGFLPRSVVIWEQPLAADALGAYAFVLPDGTIVQGQLNGLAEPLTRPLPSGTIVTLGPQPGGPAGRAALWQGETLACQLTVAEGQAVLKVGVRPPAPTAAGQTFAWHSEQANRQADPARLARPAWFEVRQGELRRRPLAELHVTARDGVAVVQVKQAGLPLNSQPLVVHGVEAGLTAVYYEPERGLVRPIGVWTDQAMAQLPADRENVVVIIGNLVRSSVPGLRVDIVRETDDAGQPSGRWRVDAHNPTTTPVDTTFTVPEAFAGLLKTRRHQARIEAGASIRLVIE